MKPNKQCWFEIRMTRLKKILCYTTVYLEVLKLLKTFFRMIYDSNLTLLVFHITSRPIDHSVTNYLIVPKYIYVFSRYYSGLDRLL